MLKRILVPLDGSEYGPAAIAKAARMATRTGAQVRGLAIVDEPSIMRPEAEPVGAAGFLEHKQATRMQQARESCAKIQKEFLDACRREGVTAETIERTGDPLAVIVAESHQADVLVMGQVSAFKHITQAGPCHTMRDVMRASPRPLVVVPKQTATGRGVWFATDGSHGASRALHMYQMMGLMGKRQVRVIAIHRLEAEAKQRCAEAEAFLSLHGHQVEASPVVTDRHPWEQLQAMLSEEPPEVMIMGAYGTSGWREMVFGSVTSKLIEQSPVPLFVYH